MADSDDELSTDARPNETRAAQPPGDTSPEMLMQLLQRERVAHAETSKDLQVERAAHDETAEKMVQLQQRLEVTLQELANLERFTKRQQTVPAPAGTPPHVERLLKEESYLKSRLLFVQQACARAAHGMGWMCAVTLTEPPRAFACVSQELADARAAKADATQDDADDRAGDTALSI